jgi:hypothetical protein
MTTSEYTWILVPTTQISAFMGTGISTGARAPRLAGGARGPERPRGRTANANLQTQLAAGQPVRRRRRRTRQAAQQPLT